MREVSEIGRLFILLANRFRTNKVELTKYPMYIFARYNNETSVMLNIVNYTFDEVEDLGLNSRGRKWLITN